MGIPVMHGIGPGSKGLARLSSVGGGSRILAVHHVGGDGQNGSGGNAAAVGVVAPHIIHEGVHQLCGDGVYPVVVVAVFGEVSFHFIIHHDAVLIPHGFYLRVLDGGQGVGHHGQSGDSGGEPAGHLLVVKSHLDPLIAVLVVHIVDDVQCVYIYAGQPFHHVLVGVHDLVIIQVLGGNGAVFRSHLLFGDLVHTAVDGVEQAFCQVGPGAEELHFLAHPHGRNAAGDGVVVSVGHSHQVVVLVLDGRGHDGSLGAEPLEVHGELGGPEHRQVGLRSRSQVLQGVEIAVGHFRHHVAAVDSHAADGLRHPGGVSGEQGVVLRRSGEFHQAQLHDKVIHKLLDLLLCVPAFRQIPLGVDVQEGGGAS